jgi:hypothetical protein
MADDIFNGTERRAYFRFDKALPVRFRLCGEGQDRVYTAITKNISHGGICLEVQEEKEELIEKLSQNGYKPAIDVETPLPNPDEKEPSKPVWLNGIVDWDKKPGDKDSAIIMGLAFNGMSDDVRKKLHDFILDEFVKRYGKNE